MGNGITISDTGSALAERALVPRLVTGASCMQLPDGRLRFESPGASATLPPLPAGLSEVLANLDGNTRSLMQMMDRIDEVDGPPVTALLFAHLARFSAQGLLTHHVVAGGIDYASIEPTGMRYRFLVQPIPETRELRLSRFSVIRREEDHMVIESGLGHGLVRIHDETTMGVVGMLATPHTPESFRARASALGLDPAAMSGLLVLLMNGKVFEGAEELDDDELQLWNPHDLLFHMSSRYGRLGGHFGGNFRHVGSIDPAPAVRPQHNGPTIPLPAPVLEDLLEHDPPFQQVVETRRSIYRYGPSILTLDDLGEFLYRVARVRWLGSQTVASSLTGQETAMEVSSRPTPAGGRGYDLELYLTIGACKGIDAGMYHYDPAGHQLTRIRPADSLTGQMLSFASIASPGIEPQVLITLAARFRRMMWKYDRLAYAATLKHVGVMMQQMYLAATAMHLAPTALGSGNIELFAAATGNAPEVEGSVGEFVLGSSPEGPRSWRPTMIHPDAAS